MPLPRWLAEIGRRVVRFYEGRSTAPFIVGPYEPRDEYAVRREVQDLRLWLEADTRGIQCETISLAEVFWEALQSGGQLEMIVEAEQLGEYHEAHLAVRQILARPPTLADRVVRRVSESGPRSAIFLDRAGALYPAHRTSTLLDALRDRVDRPVTLLYPGRLVGDYGLRFMGKTEPAYGYRALIVPRGMA